MWKAHSKYSYLSFFFKIIMNLIPENSNAGNVPSVSCCADVSKVVISNVLYAGVPTEPRCDPVLIVGAGLSAADAVLAARFRSLPIVHMFRKKAGTLGKELPENMYPEYHKVSAVRLSSASGCRYFARNSRFHLKSLLNR
jgi:hypothetical protein